MTITQDLHGRLRAALPDAVPVLRPEDAQTPLHAAPVDAQGRPVVGAGERGLGAYLQQHPQGYVQIGEEQGFGIALDGAAGSWLITVDCIAPDPPGRDALLRDALAVATRAGVRQTHFTLLTPPTTRKDASGFHAAQLILIARTGI